MYLAVGGGWDGTARETPDAKETGVGANGFGFDGFDHSIRSSPRLPQLVISMSYADIMLPPHNCALHVTNASNPIQDFTQYHNLTNPQKWVLEWPDAGFSIRVLFPSSHECRLLQCEVGDPLQFPEWTLCGPPPEGGTEATMTDLFFHNQDFQDYYDKHVEDVPQFDEFLCYADHTKVCMPKIKQLVRDGHEHLVVGFESTEGSDVSVANNPGVEGTLTYDATKGKYHIKYVDGSESEYENSDDEDNDFFGTGTVSSFFRFRKRERNEGEFQFQSPAVAAPENVAVVVPPVGEFQFQYQQPVVVSPAVAAPENVAVVVPPVVVPAGSTTVGSVAAKSISLAPTDTDGTRVGFPALGIKHTTPVLVRLLSGKMVVIIYGGRPVNANHWGGNSAATFIHTLLINESFTSITAMQQSFKKGVVGMMHRAGAAISSPTDQGGSMMVFQGVSYNGSTVSQIASSEITITLKVNDQDGSIKFGSKPTTQMPPQEFTSSSSRCNAACCQTSDIVMIFGGEICPGSNPYNRAFAKYNQILVRPILGHAMDWHAEQINVDFFPWCAPKMFWLNQRKDITVVVVGGYLGTPALFATDHEIVPQNQFHIIERRETMETAIWTLKDSVEVQNMPMMALAHLNAVVIGDRIFSYYNYHLYLISTLEKDFMVNDDEELSVSASKLVGRVPAFTRFGMMIPLSTTCILLFGGKGAGTQPFLSAVFVDVSNAHGGDANKHSLALQSENLNTGIAPVVVVAPAPVAPKQMTLAQVAKQGVGRLKKFMQNPENTMVSFNTNDWVNLGVNKKKKMAEYIFNNYKQNGLQNGIYLCQFTQDEFRERTQFVLEDEQASDEEDSDEDSDGSGDDEEDKEDEEDEEDEEDDEDDEDEEDDEEEEEAEEEEEEEEEEEDEQAPPESIEQQQLRLAREFHEGNPAPPCFTLQHRGANQEGSGHVWKDGNPPATKKVGATSNTKGNVVEYECFNVNCATGTDNGRATLTYYSDPKGKFCKTCCAYVLKCKDHLPNIDNNGTGIEYDDKGAVSHVLKGRRHYCAACSGHQGSGVKRKRTRKKRG